MSDPLTDPEFATSALVTIDTQRDVLDDGAFPIAGTSSALAAMRRLLDSFRDVGRPIVHIVRLYEPDGSNAEPCRRQLIADGNRVLLRGTDGCQLASELLPGPDVRLDDELLLDGGVQSLSRDEVAIYKPRWGAFYRTPLEEHLRRLQVSTIVFAGCNFPNCPRTSIYEASERDFRIVVARDAISGLDERGEDELRTIGVQVMSADQIAGAVEGSRLVSTAGRSNS